MVGSIGIYKDHIAHTNGFSISKSLFQATNYTHTILFFILLASIIAVAKSQVWVGNYTVEPGCSTVQCCCFHGQATVTRPFTEILELNVSRIGQCSGATIYHIRSSYPNGFQVLLTIVDDVVELTLSSDSRIVTGNNPQRLACNSRAVKTEATSGAIKQHMNIAIPLSVRTLLQLITNFATI
jgi:hypothetical protein